MTTPSPPARPAPRGAGWIHWQGRVHRLAEALLVGDGARGGREFWVRDPEGTTWRVDGQLGAEGR